MIRKANTSSSQGSYIQKMGSVYSRNCDVIYLVHCHAIRAFPCAFMYSQIRENRSTYYKPLPLATVDKSSSVIISDTEAVIANHPTITRIITTHFSVHVSHKYDDITC